MSEIKSFIKQFWKAKETIGAVTPSSRFLTEKILENIDFENKRIFAELGPGTGVFTDKIIQRMKKDAVLLVFEINDSFYLDLHRRITDNRVHLIHDSAERIEQYLNEFNLFKMDAIISSLPLTFFSTKLRSSILLASKRSLAPTGKYIQYQYSLQAKSELEHLFNNVKVTFTLFNVPPAFIYTCYKNQE